MVFRINFELTDSTKDSVVVSGETIEEVRKLANCHLELRRGKNAWSEKLD